MGLQGSSPCSHCGERSHWKSRLKTNGNCPHCQNTFETEVAKPPVRAATPDEINMTAWQPGYKRCSNCQKFTRGARSEECIHCENLFPKRGESKTVEAEAETEPEKFVEVASFPPVYTYPEGQIRRIYIPAGQCPVKIERANKDSYPTDDAIKRWAADVRQTVLNTDKAFVGNSGLFYWAIQQVNGDHRYKYNSDEMNYLKAVINELPDVKIRKVAG